MCKACQKEDGCSRQTERRCRLKLWEVKPQYHCAILGTCLSVQELQKVVRQAGVMLERACSDYELHGTLVGQAAEKNRASHHLQKLLQRKYRRWVQTVAPLSDPQALGDFWHAQIREGEVAGPFWALVTHPDTDMELLTRAYGEVHMLSHLQGAANRAERKRLVQQAEEIGSLKTRLGRLRRHHQSQIRQRDRWIHEQGTQIRSLKALLSTAKPQAEERAGETSHCAAGVRERRLARAEERLSQREMELDRLQHEAAGLRELLSEAREEHSAMEQAMAQLLKTAANGEPAARENLDLHGQRILYVGGRSTLTPQLRSLVESSNGCFDHHDGGLEQSRAGLHGCLAGADMVFCPVDCVSHDACLRVKRYCRQRDKRFIPLRSAGLSAFAAGLRQSCQHVRHNRAERQLAFTHVPDQ